MRDLDSRLTGLAFADQYNGTIQAVSALALAAGTLALGVGGNRGAGSVPTYDTPTPVAGQAWDAIEEAFTANRAEAQIVSGNPQGGPVEVIPATEDRVPGCMSALPNNLNAPPSAKLKVGFILPSNRRGVKIFEHRVNYIPEVTELNQERVLATAVVTLGDNRGIIKVSRPEPLAVAGDREDEAAQTLNACDRIAASTIIGAKIFGTKVVKRRGQYMQLNVTLHSPNGKVTDLPATKKRVYRGNMRSRKTRFEGRNQIQAG